MTPVPNLDPKVPDLSRNAVDARRRARAETGDGGGWTGRQLIHAAARIFDRAKQLRKVAEKRPPGPRRRRAEQKADEALRTAAKQIRLAAMTPLDRGYLHAMTIEQIQNAHDEVVAAYRADPAALAVDTHRKIQDQRRRVAAEGGPHR